MVWVLDSGNGWIYRLGADGKMEAVINGAKLLLYNPKGLAIGSSGDIFVADTGGARILHLDKKVMSLQPGVSPELDQTNFKIRLES